MSKVLQMIRFEDNSIFICDFCEKTKEISIINSETPDLIEVYKSKLEKNMIITEAYAIPQIYLINFIHNNDEARSNGKQKK